VQTVCFTGVISILNNSANVACSFGRIPGEKSGEIRQSVQQEFLAARKLEDADEIMSILRKGRISAQYITDFLIPKANRSSGGTYVVRDGQVVAGRAESMGRSGTVWDGQLDPADIARHRSLQERFHFGGRRDL